MGLLLLKSVETGWADFELLVVAVGRQHLPDDRPGTRIARFPHSLQFLKSWYGVRSILQHFADFFFRLNLGKNRGIFSLVENLRDFGGVLQEQVVADLTFFPILKKY